MKIMALPYLLAALAVLLGGALHRAAAEDVVLTRGPYLQLGTPTSIVVRWRTASASPSLVRFGPDPLHLVQSVLDDTLGTEHEIRLADLSPATRYFYAVGTPDTIIAGVDSATTFRTAPTTGTAVPTRVWITGDSGTAGADQRAVRDAFLDYAADRPANLWLSMGDNAYPYGTDEEYQAAFFDSYAMLLRNTVCWSTRGNHDFVYEGSANDYFEFFTMPASGEAGGVPSGTEAYYSFDHGNIHFICVDAEGLELSPEYPMFDWLLSDAASTDLDWTIAFWHQPPYSKGTHDSDKEEHLIAMRALAVPILESVGVDLVLSGHSHNYERSYLIDGHHGRSFTFADSMLIDGGDGNPAGDGVYRKPTFGPAPHEGCVYNIIGCSSGVGTGPFDHPAMYTGQSVLGSVVLDIDGGRLEATFLDLDGVVQDFYVIVKGGGASQEPEPEAGPPLAVTLEVLPNPCAQRTTFAFALARPGIAQLVVFDAAGRHVRTVLDAGRGAGSQWVDWDARSQGGRRVANGLYFARLTSGGRVTVAKVLVAR